MPNGAVEFLKAVLGEDAIMAEPFDFQKTAVGCKASLTQLGQIVEPLADAKIPGVVDGGLGAQRTPFLMILLDPRILVMDVERWCDAFGDDAGAETSGCSAGDTALEDELHLFGTADVEVLTDHLLEKNAPMDWPVENLSR